MPVGYNTHDMPNDSRIKCRRNYLTAPVPGFSTPERVRVLRRAEGLAGYYVVRPLDRGLPRSSYNRTGTVAMHESHLGEVCA